jgi:hypothetical protein
VSESYARPTEYQVSVFPDEMFDSEDMRTAEAAHTWALTVAYRGAASGPSLRVATSVSMPMASGTGRSGHG